MPTKRDVATYCMLLSVQFIFGGFHVLGFVAMGTMNAFVFACLRIGVATPVLFVVAWFKDRYWPSASEHPVLFLLGILGVTSNQVLFLLGLKFTNPIIAAVTQPAIPVFTALICIALKLERGGWLKHFAILFTCAGCVVMVLEQKHGSVGGSHVLLGYFLLFGNCIAFAIYLVIQKPVLERIPAFTVAAWAFVYGFVGVAISVAVDVIFVEKIDFVKNLQTQPPIAWVAVLYASLMATCVAYVFNTLGVKYSNATTAAVFTPFQPIASATFSVIFLHKMPTVGEGLGAIGIVAGLLLVTYARDRENKRAAALSVTLDGRRSPDDAPPAEAGGLPKWVRASTSAGGGGGRPPPINAGSRSPSGGGGTATRGRYGALGQDAGARPLLG